MAREKLIANQIASEFSPHLVDLVIGEYLREKAKGSPIGRLKLLDPARNLILFGGLSILTLNGCAAPGQASQGGEFRINLPFIFRGSPPPTEVVPTSPELIPTATPESIPTSTPVPTSAPTPEPSAIPTPEVKEFDNGIISPKAYTKAEYIQWNTPDGRIAEGIGLTLEAGEEFRIPGDMQVAAGTLTRDGKPVGYMIVAARKKDGSQIIVLGNVIPVGIGRVGKDLPAETVVAISGESGLTYVEHYTQLLILSAEELRERFPDQSKKDPRFIGKEPPPSPAKSQGVTFYDVPPPKG